MPKNKILLAKKTLFYSIKIYKKKQPQLCNTIIEVVLEAEMSILFHLVNLLIWSNYSGNAPASCNSLAEPSISASSDKLISGCLISPIGVIKGWVFTPSIRGYSLILLTK